MPETEQGNQDEEPFRRRTCCRRDGRARSVWRCPRPAEDEIDRSQLGAERAEKTSCREAADAFTLMFIHIMMKKTLIDIAKVRLGRWSERI